MSASASLLDYGFFLLIVTIGLLRFVFPARHYLWYGVISSGLVVAIASPTTFAVIAGTVLGFIFPLHRLYRMAFDHDWNPRVRAAILPIGIGVLVAVLVLSKAYRYFTLPWFGGSSFEATIASIVGLSYFLFRAIDFLHLQALLKLDERSPGPLLFYTLFPSTLTSGPIQKYQDFRTQIRQPSPLTRALVLDAAYRITRGYFRKVFLGFVLNAWVARLLAHSQLSGFDSVLLIVALYAYFYFDFAGYSDIAIGLGLLMGIKAPENFRRPFLATTISEFWRNWHISLVDWFRDHVFIPLGGMQSSRLKAGLLAMLVMVLCGLWHGLTIPFILWGVWHGTMLLLEAVLVTKPIPPAQRTGLRYFGRVAWTNLRVAVPSILFLPNPADISRVAAGLTHWNLT